MNAPWHVLGAGAIGGLFALRLAQAGEDVVLLLRETPQGRRRTLTRSGVDGTARHRFPVESATDESPIQRLLVATKAHAVSDAVMSVSHRLTADAEVLLLANGMGFVEELATRLPGLDPVLATTTEGAFRDDPRNQPGRIHHAGSGDTLLGRPGQAQPPPALQTFCALPRCAWETDIAGALWRKLAINAAINALTAIHRCANGELAAKPERASEVQALCTEISTICLALGQGDAARDLLARVSTVIHNTAANRSSMLQDIEAGRQTEVAYINGYLVQAARQAGLAAPLNSRLLQAVQAIESA